MSENPYEAPSAPAEIVGIRGGGTSKDVRQVANYQKGVLYCILVQIVIIATRFATLSGGYVVPGELTLLLTVVSLVVGVISAVFVILVTMKVYHPVVGVLFAVLTCVPCLGLLVLLLINQRATSLLRQNGIEVGLLGAKTPLH